MMEFSELKSMWEIDSKIDKNKLGDESIKTPQLHSKWYNILVDIKIEHKREELAYNREKVRAKTYYSGDYTKDDDRYKTLGAQPRKLKTNEDLNDYINADKEIQKIKLRMFVAEEKIDFVLNVLNQLNNRNFQISNAIKWTKFMNGDND